MLMNHSQTYKNLLMKLSTTLVFLLICVLFHDIAWGAPSANNTPPGKMKVAVVEFEVKGEFELKEAGSIVAEWMINSVDKTSKFDLQERVLLKKILAEQKLSLGGLVDEKDATAKIGQLFGVEAIITGSVIRWQQMVSVTARLINTSSGSIIRTAEINSGNINAIPSRIDELALIITGLKNPDKLADLIDKSSNQNLPTDKDHRYWHDPVTGMDFVWVPEGCFKMGQSEEERQETISESSAKTYKKKYNDETPQHEVCVDGFWMGMYEVTNRQLRLFDPAHNSKSYKGISLDGEKQPAVYVSWNQAKSYSEWLTKKHEAKSKFRLPSEAEWEHACRAGSESSRFWGTDSDEAGEYANVYDGTSKNKLNCKWEFHDCDDEYVVTAPVGSLYPNDYQLYDMLGNVWEWTMDTYSETSYSTHEKSNPVHTGKGNKARRGGSWYSAPGSVRCSNRGNRSADRKNKEIGFRLIRIEVTN